MAGLPFWYYHDPGNPKAVNSRLHAGPVVQDPNTNEQIFIHRALFYDLFPQFESGVDWETPSIVECHQTESEIANFGEIRAMGGNTRIKIFRAYDPMMQGLIPVLRGQKNPEKVAIGALKHGDGYYILAAFDLRGKDHTSIDKVIGAILGWIKFERQRK